MRLPWRRSRVKTWRSSTRRTTRPADVMAVVGDFAGRRHGEAAGNRLRGLAREARASRRPGRCAGGQGQEAAARRQARLHADLLQDRQHRHRAIEPGPVLIEIVNTLFGGRFTSMINTELRIKSGLTYGASSGFPSGRRRGRSTSTATPATPTREGPRHDARRAQAPARQGISEDDLKSAKAYLKGQFPPDIETSDQLAGYCRSSSSTASTSGRLTPTTRRSTPPQ